MSCPKYPKIDTLYTRDEKFKVTDEIRRPEFLVPREWLVTEKIHGCNIRVSLEQEACPHLGLDHPGAGLTGTCDTPWIMQINGRNDNSQIPPNLLLHLQETFTTEGLKSLWRCKSNCNICSGNGWVEYSAASPPVMCDNLSSYPITLYGEGYGGGIQKGGGEYTSKTKGGAVSFRLFDVLIGAVPTADIKGVWLRRVDIEDVAAKLGVKPVPLIPPPKPIADGPDPESARINLGGVTVAYGELPWYLESITEFVKGGAQSAVAYEEGTEGHKAEGIVAFTAEPLYNNRGQRLMFKLKSSDFKGDDD